MKPVELQDAATILVLRDGPQGLEVLMGRRSRSTRFSAGAYVFPGGGVDASDVQAIGHCVGADPVEEDARFGEADSLRFYLAAARELFEEAGLWLFDGERPSDWDTVRRELHAGRLALSNVLGEGAMRLDCRNLHYFRFWTTPPGMTRRYRTRFFAVLAPVDQHVEVDGVEIVEHCWTRPTEMLARYERKEVDLIFPTFKELQRLAAYGSAAEALAALSEPSEVNEIRTRHRFENGRFVEVLMPGDPGYEDLPGW